MSLLSDRDIAKAIENGDLIVEPLGVDAIQPASVDLRLGCEIRRWPVPGSVIPSLGERGWWPTETVIDPMQMAGPTNLLVFRLDRFGDTFDVMPHEFVLAHTHEHVALRGALGSQVYGKSSIGRCGLRVENAGYIDPGFEGQITLELRNETRYPIRITVGMPICQIVIHRLTSPPDAPYGLNKTSRYQYQTGATESRYGIDRRL
jgi:dCTP deaminase